MVHNLIVTQECSNCGKQFDLKYSDEFGCGTYSFATDPCDCDAPFYPIEEMPSISEWIDSLRNDNIYDESYEAINIGLDNILFDVMKNNGVDSGDITQKQLDEWSNHVDCLAKLFVELCEQNRG